jgi:hypothetical protein
MPPDILDSEQLVGLRMAFEGACVDLGIGYGDHDKNRREHLAAVVLSLADERNADVIRTRAVYLMRPPVAGLFHACPSSSSQ